MGTTADKLNKLIETKAAIKTAITNKGVEISDTDTFASYADKINNIQTGGGGYNFPDNMSFAYSDFGEGPIPEDVLNYVNTRNGGEHMFYYATVRIISPDTIFTPANADHMFDELNRSIISGDPTFEKIILDLSRLQKSKVYGTFSNTSVYEVEFRNTSSVLGFISMFSDFNSSIQYIHTLDLTSCTEFRNNFDCNWLFKIAINNLGAVSSLTSIDFSGAVRFGVELEDYPRSQGAKQVLIDSLITNSFDRATADYSVCTISLSKDTKALLTEDEIAQITAKGFTIA